jgi:hypothetical protein
MLENIHKSSAFYRMKKEEFMGHFLGMEDFRRQELATR